MKLTIIHFGGTRKTVELEDITPQGWVQVRYPNGGGCYRFALAHGNIETKRGVSPEWRLDAADLAQLKEQAVALKIKTRKPPAPGRPRRPRKKAPSKQAELFE